MSTSPKFIKACHFLADEFLVSNPAKKDDVDRARAHLLDVLTRDVAAGWLRPERIYETLENRFGLIWNGARWARDWPIWLEAALSRAGSASHYPEGTGTKTGTGPRKVSFCYQYRDGSNWKNYGCIVLANPERIAVDAAQEEIISLADSDELFVAESISIETLYFNFCCTEDDHGFHEFVSLTPADDLAKPTDNRTLQEFLQCFREAAASGWVPVRDCQGHECDPDD